VNFGLAATLAMWTVGYVTHLPGLAPTSLGGKAVVGLLLIAAFASIMMIAGRTASRGTAAVLGGTAGLTSGLLNLMILGAFLSEPPVEGGSAVAPNAGVAALGFLVTSCFGGAIFAALGSAALPRSFDISASLDRWHGRLAALAALCIVPVLLTGGLVTSHGAGLAVPDWPNSYTANMFLYPLSKMTGGIYYEHTHRLFGALAGVGCLLLFFVSVIRLIAGRGDRAREDTNAEHRNPPLPLRRTTLLAAVALVIITIQGLLGGYRVIIADGSSDVDAWKDTARQQVYTGEATANSFALTVDNTTSINLALAHGVSGQITFAIVAVIAAMLSVRWTRARAERRTRGASSFPRDAFLRGVSLLLAITAVLQLILGAATRHHESQLIMVIHIAMGTLVVLLAAAAAFRAMATFDHEPGVRRIAKALAAVVTVQFMLGFGAMIFAVPYYGTRGADQPTGAVLAATSHQALGAAFLALAALTCAWSWRLTAAKPKPAPAGAAAPEATAPNVATA
jgi:cytochrome c oxidase assembly protein subunit 15